jgi:hypothetical protein
LDNGGVVKKQNSDAARQLCDMTAVQVVDLLKRREVSSVELVEAAIARIETIDPVVNALPIRRFETARKEAAAFDRSKNIPVIPGWLGGLPIAIKDYNDVEGSVTTYGSPIFADNRPTSSDRTVSRLQRLGGIAIAKSNVPEFAGSIPSTPCLVPPAIPGTSAGRPAGRPAVLPRRSQVGWCGLPRVTSSEEACVFPRLIAVSSACVQASDAFPVPTPSFPTIPYGLKGQWALRRRCRIDAGCRGAPGRR